MAATLLLDRTPWDLCLDSAGNIAVAAEPYALAQDVASEARVWLGEAYYDTTLGVPYPLVMGRKQPVQLLKSALADAASRVPGVSNPVVYLTAIQDREIGGQIQFAQGTATL